MSQESNHIYWLIN